MVYYAAQKKELGCCSPMAGVRILVVEVACRQSVNAGNPQVSAWLI
jgi:hypothetical protein